MRDPSRIEPFCQELTKLWKLVPDWRFGQLFCNLQRQYCNDLFYVDDERMLELMSDLLNHIDNQGE